MLQAFVNIDRRERRRLTRAQHPVRHRAQAVRLVDDHPGVLRQLRIRQCPLEQLGGAANTAQGVLDLMGDATHQRAGGLVGVHQPLFPGNPQQPVQGLHLHQQRHVLATLMDRADAVIDHRLLSRRHIEPGFAAGERVPFVHALLQGTPRVLVVEKVLRQPLPENA